MTFSGFVGYFFKFVTWLLDTAFVLLLGATTLGNFPMEWWQFVLLFIGALISHLLSKLFLFMGGIDD